MKYLFVFLLLGLVSCGGDKLSEEDKKWIEKKIVQVCDSIHKSSMLQSTVLDASPKELWEKTSISIPDKYIIGKIPPLHYTNIQDDEWGLNLSNFYPIGWSLDGNLFAYRYEDYGEMSYSNSVIIFNTVDDTIEDELVLKISDPNESYENHQPNDNAVEDFLKRHQIALHFDYKKGDSFKSSLNGKEFTFESIVDKQLYDMGQYNSGNIEIYANMESPVKKRKRIATIEYEGQLSEFNIHGLIKSPINNKVILLTVLNERGYEAELCIDVHLYGCNLDEYTFK